MVRDADKYKAEDEQQRDRISAKNGLESYAFNMKSTVEDEKLKDKISDDDKKTIIDKCNEVIEWLDKNQVRGASYLSGVESVVKVHFLCLRVQTKYFALSGERGSVRLYLTSVVRL